MNSLKVCFVGVGSIGKRHIRNLISISSNKGIRLNIDALRREESTRTDVDEYLESVYTDEKALPSDYDVIFITNPTQKHVSSIKNLHDHAKHFFIEKPVASADNIEQLIGINYRNDSVYYVACPLRYTGVISYLKSQIDVSKVNSVRSICSSYLPDWRQGIDYRKTYSAHRDLGGGVDIDLIHEWDYLTYIFGMPQNVYSLIGKVSSLEIDSNDYAVYLAKYENMIMELHLDYFGRKDMRKVEVFMEDETIEGDLIANKVTYMKGNRVIDLSEERDDYQKRELVHFLRLIDGFEKCDNDIIHATKVFMLTQGIIKK